MTNQEILDSVDSVLTHKRLDPKIREQLLDDVWMRLSDNRSEPLDRGDE